MHLFGRLRWMFCNGYKEHYKQTNKRNTQFYWTHYDITTHRLLHVSALSFPSTGSTQPYKNRCLAFKFPAFRRTARNSSVLNIRRVVPTLIIVCFCDFNKIVYIYLSKWATWCTKFLFYTKIISYLYMFRAHVLIIRGSKLHCTASGIVTPTDGRQVHRSREDCSPEDCSPVSNCAMIMRLLHLVKGKGKGKSFPLHA